MSGRPAVLLDRDGVLVEDVGYISSAADLRVLPGVPEALRALAGAGFALAVVSNQSGVARGVLSEAQLQAIHQELGARLAQLGAPALAWFYCPHHPEAGAPPYRRRCDCRKPAPGLLFRAREALGLDLERSWVVGDQASDAEAARAAGCRAVLVHPRGGAGAGVRAAAVVDGLPEAARWILAQAPLAPARPEVAR